MSQLDAVANSLTPQDIDAERSFAGGLILRPDGFDMLDMVVPCEAFHHPKIRMIYNAILELHEDNEPADALTIQARLKERGELKDVGEYTIPELMTDVLTGANVEHYAKIIMERFRQRKLMAYGMDAAARAQKLGDSSEIVAELESNLANLEDGRTESTLFAMPVVVDEVQADIHKRKTEGRQSIGVTTGFLDLDALTSGFCPSEMFVIGARPSQGKTALAANMLMEASRKSTALFVTLEMHRNQIVQRMLSGVSGVDSMKLRHAAVNDSDLARIRDAAAKMRRLDFHISDIPGASVADVIHAVRQTKRKHPGLAVVAVDYLQLIRPDGKQSEYEHISNVSRRLKALARSLNICVVALSQLNRLTEARKDHRPTMSDLRSSGQIEQDADVIALLHRPEQHNPDDRPGEADLIVCKVRNGPIGEVSLTFDKATTTFRNHAPEIGYQPSGKVYSAADM